MLLSFYHTCGSKQHHVLHRESLLCHHFHILVGIFILEFGLYIPMMGFLKCPRSSWASKLDAHPLSFSLSFHTLIALVHPLHGNPYSLTLIYVDGHLHSPPIRLVDVRLSPFLSSPHNPHHHILFYLQCYVHGSRSCIA